MLVQTCHNLILFLIDKHRKCYTCLREGDCLIAHVWAVSWVAILWKQSIYCMLSYTGVLIRNSCWAWFSCPVSQNTLIVWSFSYIVFYLFEDSRNLAFIEIPLALSICFYSKHGFEESEIEDKRWLIIAQVLHWKLECPAHDVFAYGSDKQQF